MSAEIILVFESTSQVMNAEDLLEDNDLPFDLIPVPKEVNPNCGLAISFKESDKKLILSALNNAGLKPSASYIRQGDDFRPGP